MRAEQPGAAPGTVPGTVLDVTSYRIAQLGRPARTCCGPRRWSAPASRSGWSRRCREAGSAWVEMWDRLWRIDTLFEAGQLPAVSRELADLASCVGRVQVPVARWHLLQYSATHAYATGRYADAIRLAGTRSRS